MTAIKEYNIKIKSLNNTQKITKTMKMVAASKLRKAHEAQAKAKLYARDLTSLISRISASVHPSAHPLLMARENVKNVLILVFTSDKGLCGAFNNSANKQVASWIKENRGQYHKISLSFCGKRGYLFFHKKEHVRKHYENVIGDPHFADASAIGQEVSASFLNGEFDEVYLTYNQFFSPLYQKTVFEKILPIDPSGLNEEKIEKSTEYIFEPAATELLSFLIPHFLYFKIYFSLLENSAGEHGARMTAMDSSTKNATELINDYTLLRNRARQSAITTELIEIVAGAEALK
ncbi:MAG: ATP synthase F1 subunit gamma [Omnitrophica WOR_2 bacterium GWC2_45_7]|nr:MAG: ATP synthase F1 subunit gamma [Omnitrophica WOR_2 bacterium GWC2_45_7]